MKTADPAAADSPEGTRLQIKGFVRPSFSASFSKSKRLWRTRYGQLMAGPQMIAYLLQIHYFFQEYKVNLIL
ncbi:MAG: hypothetical protein ACLSCU_03745 [Eubacterium sp.]